MSGLSKGLALPGTLRSTGCCGQETCRWSVEIGTFRAANLGFQGGHVSCVQSIPEVRARVQSECGCHRLRICAESSQETAQKPERTNVQQYDIWMRVHVYINAVLLPSVPKTGECHDPDKLVRPTART